MKMSQLVVFGLIMVCLATAGDIQAGIAPEGWNRCKIDYVGVLFGSSVMRLISTDGKFTGTVWVKMDDSHQKELLATALTARSIGAEVFCWILSAQTETVVIGGESHQMVYALGPVPDN